MTTKERAKRFADLRKEMPLLEMENRDWLTVCLLAIQDDLRRTDIGAAQKHLDEIIDAVAEED